MDVEEGEDREAEDEVVVVASGVGGEGVVGEVSKERMQTRGNCRDVVHALLIEGSKSVGKVFPKSIHYQCDRDSRHKQCLRLPRIIFTW